MIYQCYIKRIFDLVLALIGLLILSPILLFICILSSALNDNAGIFFIQDRIGRHALPFKLIKFKTMTDKCDSTGKLLPDEGRVTRLGRWLRRTKLDELPELWNVLIGDMSFVGPRPDVPGYADKLTGEDRLILELRPGITCEASIKYANEEELLAKQPDPLRYNDEVIYPDKVRMNLEYYHNHSFRGDIKIIWRTLFR